MAAHVPLRDLVRTYDSFLLDAYGILVDATRALPGAREFINALKDAQKPYCIITNDASRDAIGFSKRLAQVGLEIEPSCICTSGDMLVPFFQSRVGARTAVLGTAETEILVRRGGGTLVPLTSGMEIDVLAICDDGGFDFHRGTEIALSSAIRALDAGRQLEVVVANPDLIYPRSSGEIGITAGSIALIVETVLKRRFGEMAPTFEIVGKPGHAIFAEGFSRLDAAQDGTPGTGAKTQTLMIGDQLETDVAGAIAAGIDVLLVEGVSKAPRHGLLKPTFVLPDLRL